MSLSWPMAYLENVDCLGRAVKHRWAVQGKVEKLDRTNCMKKDCTKWARYCIVYLFEGW